MTISARMPTILGSCNRLPKKRTNMVPVNEGRKRLRQDVCSVIVGSQIDEANDTLVDLLHHKVHLLQTVLHSLAVTTEG